MKNEVTLKSSFKKWWGWVSWSFFGIILAQIFLTSFYWIFADAWIARIENDENSFELYLATTSTTVSVYFDVVRDMFILAMVGFFATAILSKDKQKIVSSIKTIWITIFSIMVISSFALNVYVISHIDHGALASNIDNAILENPSEAIDKQYLINRATVNYTLMIWTQTFQMFVMICLIMLAFSQKSIKVIFFVLISKTISQLAFDLIFFVPGISPLEWGAIGVSFSTLANQVVISSICIFLVFKMFNLKPSDFKAKPLYNGTSSYWKKSMWSGAESLLRNLGFYFCIIGVLNQLGPTSYAAWNYSAGMYWGLLLIPQMAMQQTVAKQVAVGEEVGIARKKAMYAGHHFIGLMVLVWLMFLPFADEYIYWQLDGANNYQIYQSAISGFYILFIPMLAFSFVSMFDAYYYARQQTNVMFWKTLVATLILYIPWYIVERINIDVLTYDFVVWVFASFLIIGTVITYIFVIVYFAAFKLHSKKNDELYMFETNYINKTVNEDDEINYQLMMIDYYVYKKKIMKLLFSSQKSITKNESILNNIDKQISRVMDEIRNLIDN